MRFSHVRVKQENALFAWLTECEKRIMVPTMMEPAKTIIEMCGGVTAVAGMVGRDGSRVRRWAYPKSKGGSDGLIPSDVQVRLLAEANRRGIGLRPEHFFITGTMPTQGAA